MTSPATSSQGEVDRPASSIPVVAQAPPASTTPRAPALATTAATAVAARYASDDPAPIRPSSPLLRRYAARMSGSSRP